MIFLAIYILGAILAYLVPPFFGFNFNGGRLPTAPLFSLTWPIGLPLWICIEVGAAVFDRLETWRVQILERRTRKP